MPLTANDYGRLVAGNQGRFSGMMSVASNSEAPLDRLKRITFDPAVMGGKACIRGLRVTVGTVLGLLASGHTADEVLKAYPYLEPEDIREALAYAAWRVEEVEVPIAQ